MPADWNPKGRWTGHFNNNKFNSKKQKTYES